MTVAGIGTSRIEGAGAAMCDLAEAVPRATARIDATIVARSSDAGIETLWAELRGKVVSPKA